MAQTRQESTPLEAEDGARSELRLESPEGAVRGAVLCLPAMGTPARYYAPLQGELARQGFAVAVTELRGHGTSTVRAGRGVDFGYHELITLDLPAAIEATLGRFRRERLYLLGHSLGGQLALLFASVRSAPVAGVATVAACSVHYRGWSFPRNLLVGVGEQAALAVASALGYFPGHRLGFAGREARSVIRDWARNGRTGRYELTNSRFDFEASLRALSVPVLGLSIAGDSLAPRRAVDNLMEKLAAARVTRRHLGPDELPPKARDHFRWVKHPEAVAAELRQWVDGLGSAASAAAS